jgi:hypothetical protein
MSDSRLPSDHEYYEQMCTLMAIGELSLTEFEEFEQHLRVCPICRELYNDCCRIASDTLSLVAAQRQSGQKYASSSLEEQREVRVYLDRFYGRLNKRAQAPGIISPVGINPDVRLRFQSRRWATWFRSLIPACTAAAVLILIGAGLGHWRERVTWQLVRRPSTGAERLKPKLEQLPENGKVGGDTHRDDAVSVDQLIEDAQSLRKRLNRAVADNSKLRHAIVELGKELALSRTQADVAARNLERVENESQTEKQKRIEAEDRLATQLNTVERLRSAETEALVLAAKQDQTLVDLRSKLMIQAQAMKETSKALTGGDRRIQSLFGARNLHIVDVYDVDGNGKTKRAFGRVYYAERTLLVFYAFDLDLKRRNRSATAFQAWGYREVGSGKPQDLGLFHLDDPSASRWALKVDDPNILDHIDAVFVTLEPSYGSSAPKGRRLLYANLVGSPNRL